ncbi:MAG TPA: S-layer homology domain-containing protein [Symbiobacteriaceae bacterium]|nr:S-layer homology domain-containing protein [Symbiobacteriaceae bacterium]
MRRLLSCALVLVFALSFAPVALAADAFVTIGFLPATVKQDSWIIRGTAPAGMTVALSVNGEVRGRIIAGPSMSTYRYDLPLDPGANQILAVVEGTPAQAEGFVVRVTKSFKDTEKHWAQEDCEFLAAVGVVNGVGPDQFGPDLALTRAQFAKLVVLGLKLKPAPEPVLTFTDTPAIPDWARGFIATAVAQGLIKGFEDGTFRPDDQVTRAQLAVIAARGLRQKGISAGTGQGRSFKDDAQVPGWATADVLLTTKAGLVGDFWGPSFDADTPATRALAAAVVRRLYTAKQ